MENNPATPEKKVLVLKIVLLFLTAIVLFSVILAPLQALASTIPGPSLDRTYVVLNKGEKVRLHLLDTTKTPKWTSNRKSIATVNKAGLVQTFEKGTALITAQLGSKKYRCKVKVETPKISDTAISLQAGSAKIIKITGSSQKIQWKSNKLSVATVSAKGKVTAKKAGTAVITGKAGNKAFKCKVAVTQKPTPAPPVTGGGGTVYWVPGGTVWHTTPNCSTLKNSTTILSGTIAQSGKPRVCKVCG